MAWEAPGQIITLPCVTTGIPRFRFVNVSTAGNVIYPVVNGQTIGVIQDGTTGSTVDPTNVSVMVSGVSKLAIVSASTVGVGEVVGASSRGSAIAMAAASVAAGQVIAGSSGGASRVVSVLFPVSHSTATV